MAAPAPVPTVADFVAQFPEFSEVLPAAVSSALSRASRHIDPVVWRGKTADGVMFKAAHFLALSPFGMATKLAAKDGSTTYGSQFDQMLLEVAGGFVVAGGGRSRFRSW